MALDYAAVGDSLDDEVFIDRIVGALSAQCVVVNAEAENSANHQPRLALMGRVIANPNQYARQFAPLVCSIAPVKNLADRTAATDANLLTGVAAVWDALALRNL